MKIRYYGHPGQLTGYGKAAEGICHALLTQGAELEIRALCPYDQVKLADDNLPLASCLKKDHELDPHPDVVIVHTLPMDCARVVQIATEPATSAGGRPGVLDLEYPRPVWVAYTTWEAKTAAPAAMVASYDVFDDIWHPSAESAGGFEDTIYHLYGDRPQDKGFPAGRRVYQQPHVFDENKLPFYRSRAGLGSTDLYRFYYVGAWGARKNPMGLIRAFAHTFIKGEPVELLLACQGMTADQLTHAICATGIPPNELPSIRSDFRTVTDEEIWLLHRGADCYVTATRGEAWNLPCFEAVLAGRHVIAPFGCGHMQFLRDTSADVYASYMAPAMVETRATREGNRTSIETIGAQGLTSRSLWLEPDLRSLGTAMRRAFGSRKRDLVVSYDLAARFGWRSVGAQMVNRLNTLIRRSSL